MWIILFFVLFFLFFCFSVSVRLIVLNFPQFLKNGVVDLFLYIKYKKWREAKTGDFTAIDAFDSVCFGSGKTLSGVKFLSDIVKKYEGKKVFHDGKWKTQKIHILTNLTLNESFPSCDVIFLSNMNQILHNIERFNSDKDVLHKSFTLIDECQVSLHCRGFKNNLNPQLLKSLTECRHYNLSIFYTCPRFKQVDLLLRQSTSLVCHCKKIWRFQYNSYFLATDLDQEGSDPKKLKPKKRTGFFVLNRHYGYYNTHEIVEEIKKGDYIPESEIVALQNPKLNQNVQTS